MSLTQKAAAFTPMSLGAAVRRATGTLPATTTGSLFTVAGGFIVITNIVGIVTTAIQAQATTIKLVATPTTGAVNDLSGTVDGNALAAGGLLSVTGLAGDAMVKSTGGGVSTLRNRIIVAPGAIGITTGATSTGSIRWIMHWLPLDEQGVTVVAA